MPAGGAVGAKRASATRAQNLRHQAEQHLVSLMGAKNAALVLGGGGDAGGRMLRAASPPGFTKKSWAAAKALDKKNAAAGKARREELNAKPFAVTMKAVGGGKGPLPIARSEKQAQANLDRYGHSWIVGGK